MDKHNSGRVTILHTNDFHGRYQAVRLVRGSATAQTGDPGQTWDEFERDGLAGGFPALATAVERLRQARGSENVLLVDGGDTFSDDLLGNLTQGEAVIRLMNHLGYQLMALGNHDFDYGWERTRELQDLVQFPMRAANVIEKESRQPFLGFPAVVLPAGELRVGFLTLGYPNTHLTGNPKNYESLEFTDGVEAVRRYLPALRQEADLLVVLSHQGTALDRELARQVPELDLIIGAHSHDRISVERVGQVPIVQAVSDGTVLGETVITVEAGQVTGLENRLHTLWLDQFPEDEATARLVAELRAPHRAELEEVLAQAAEQIGRSYRSESPFDKLVGEILMQETGAQMAFMPGVGYGVTLLPGPITREMLYTLIPHPAKLVTMDLTGEQVRAILEQSATNQKPGDSRQIVGGLVQTAGLAWTVDYRRPPGERVSGVQVGGQPLDRERVYLIATNAGMARGLHRYKSFTEGQNVETHEVQVNQVVEQALRRMGVVRAPHLGDIVLQGSE
jgi:5'-nucleotidase / UDP-sugar diphosphatase